jgi:hypothetical protein
MGQRQNRKDGGDFGEFSYLIGFGYDVSAIFTSFAIR